MVEFLVCTFHFTFLFLGHWYESGWKGQERMVFTPANGMKENGKSKTL